MPQDRDAKAAIALDDARKMPPGDERTEAMHKATSFGMPSRFTNLSPASAPHRPYDGALNELCTITMKFGALSEQEERVDIKCTPDQQAQRLLITWTYKHSAVVRPLEKCNFGTRLIETLGRFVDGFARLLRKHKHKNDADRKRRQ